MDAFYAAIEARENPEIAGQPIVVGADPRGGRGRGVVAACSYEARAFGIHSAMPISEAYRRCPDAVYLRPRMDSYADASRRIMKILESYTERVEKLSIDEAFLDVTGSAKLFGDGVTIARRIKRRIHEQEGLTVSIGVAPNKFLAKLASDLDKPDGLVVVAPGSEADFVRPLPVERLWGVGEKTAARLHALGLRTIGDIAAADLGGLERRLGRGHAHHLYSLAHGQDERGVEPDRERKQISRETTFNEDTRERDRVERTLLALSEDVAGDLRRKDLIARTVTLKLRLAPFETVTRRHTAETAVATAQSIFEIARHLLAAADPGDRPIRLIGVGVAALQERTPTGQLSLFGEAEIEGASSRLSGAVDRIAERFGSDAVRRGKLLGGRGRREERRSQAAAEEPNEAE